MKGIVVLLALASLLLAGTASGKGDPHGPAKQQWLCILDLGTWHCVPPGVNAEAIVAGLAPSAPSVNFACDVAGDPLCDGFAISFGPPAGTHFVGTENGIRADLYAGQPCPRDEPQAIDFTGDGVPDYVFCHHYGD
jgi:hypothetical protein